ncbi:hypothetical protein FDP41_004886 [Naegleria fowleri]|uniref:Uncharacterized protein n=1 Tax=Naegleria fowleri TaxID=5763 RepID=A0A6A5BPN9_NAEFO|nr:uncharacterized protein FDP41_004886 [Naegleria fowleri]KAF0976211.1 hypothetical protein FDP41_004886 [Naegleria fowleri]
MQHVFSKIKQTNTEKKREKLLRSAEYHKPKKNEPEFENSTVPEKNNNDFSSFVQPHQIERAPLFDALQALKEKKKGDANSEQSSPSSTNTSDTPLIKKPAKYVFKKHFRQTRHPAVERNDMDERWTKYVTEFDKCSPEIIRKNTSPIEVEISKLSEEEEVFVFSKGYSSWINPDHKQKNMVNPVGDISRFKTIKRPFEPSSSPTIEEKLGLVDNTKSIVGENPLNTLQRITDTDGSDGFDMITFSGQPIKDADIYKSYLQQDIQDLELDIDEIEKLAALEEDAKDKATERALLGGSKEGDNDDDGVVLSSDDNQTDDPFSEVETLKKLSHPKNRIF